MLYKASCSVRDRAHVALILWQCNFVISVEKSVILWRNPQAYEYCNCFPNWPPFWALNMLKFQDMNSLVSVISFVDQVYLYLSLINNQNFVFVAFTWNQYSIEVIIFVVYQALRQLEFFFFLVLLTSLGLVFFFHQFS